MGTSGRAFRADLSELTVQTGPARRLSREALAIRPVLAPPRRKLADVEQALLRLDLGDYPVSDCQQSVLARSLRLPIGGALEPDRLSVDSVERVPKFVDSIQSVDAEVPSRRLGRLLTLVAALLVQDMEVVAVAEREVESGVNGVPLKREARHRLGPRQLCRRTC